jgi:PIN domain nuclease of toxin-antitoxin system
MRVTRVLIDTHVFVWWASWSERVRDEWSAIIRDPENTVYVSAATAWEISTKRRINNLDFDDDVALTAERFGFEQLPISVSHAVLAGSMPWEHRDPFDRIIVAQALQDDLVLVSADDAMKSAPGVRVL